MFLFYARIVCVLTAIVCLQEGNSLHTGLHCWHHLMHFVPCLALATGGCHYLLLDIWIDLLSVYGDMPGDLQIFPKLGGFWLVSWNVDQGAVNHVDATCVLFTRTGKYFMCWWTVGVKVSRRGYCHIVQGQGWTLLIVYYRRWKQRILRFLI